ncbi:MAG: hydroxyethylthiazole kinase [Pseudomonadota bacterium]
MLQKDSIADDIALAFDAIEELRRQSPLVHCITNSVAQQITANVLLACGGTASMTISPEEVPFFTAASRALLVNLGTLDDTRIQAIRLSVQTARDNGIPIILDPVKCELSPPRLAFARELLEQGDVILKVNRREYEALSNSTTQCLVITGVTDEIQCDGSIVKVANGHSFMDRTIATGCALGALIAALSAVSPSPRIAALAGLVWFGVAGELASETASGPGSFLPAFLDNLANLQTETISQRARINE